MEQTFGQKQRELGNKMLSLTSKWKTICDMLGYYFEVRFGGRRILKKIK